MSEYSLHIFKSYKQFNRLYEKGNIFCALDTETTGLQSKTDKVIEIGAVKFSKNGITEYFSTLINPEMQIPPICAKISGITNEMLKDKPFIYDILPDFLAFISDTILVAHNAQFDLRFINEELLRSNLAPLKNQAIDTLAFSRKVLPENKSWKQPVLAKQFNINIKSAHRAYDDARVCMELFIKLLDLFSAQHQKTKI